jgi:hypothetical protein
MSGQRQTVPLEPLEERAKFAFSHDNPEDPWSENAFAKMVGVSNGAIGRWKRSGNIPWASADTVAVRLGFHPMSIWPTEWMALDQGIIDGTDERTLKRVDRAIEQVGRILAERSSATL